MLTKLILKGSNIHDFYYFRGDISIYECYAWMALWRTPAKGLLLTLPFFLVLDDFYVESMSIKDSFFVRFAVVLGRAIVWPYRAS